MFGILRSLSIQWVFKYSTSFQRFPLLPYDSILVKIYQILGWEPGVAQGTNSYSCRLPALCQKLLFFPLTVDPLNWESQNQAKNIPVVLPSSPIKNLRQIGQTQKQRLQLYRLQQKYNVFSWNFLVWSRVVVSSQ